MNSQLIGWNIRLREYTLPRANEILRQHWSIRANHQKRLAWMLRQALLEQGRPDPAQSLRYVHIIRYMTGRQRAYDEDNLVASCKHLLDCLADELVIRDDRPEFCKLRVEQEPGDPPTNKVGTLICVTEFRING